MRIILLGGVVLLAAASHAQADVLIFVSGRTMTVQSHRVAGDVVTVSLVGGGEATFGAALVAAIEADEAPVAVPAEPVGEVVVPAAQPRSRAAYESRPFAELIDRTARVYGLDPALVHAVIETESNYEPRAVSGAGARGLMQVLPSTARGLGVRSSRQLFDPEANVDVGVRYLKLLLGEFDGDLSLALAAYNAGPGAVRKHDGVPPFAETATYVRRVLARLDP